MYFGVQLHLVHWNEDLYDSYEEASRREDGIAIIAVFVTVSCFSKLMRTFLRLREIYVVDKCIDIFSHLFYSVVHRSSWLFV